MSRITEVIARNERIEYVRRCILWGFLGGLIWYAFFSLACKPNVVVIQNVRAAEIQVNEPIVEDIVSEEVKDVSVESGEKMEVWQVMDLIYRIADEEGFEGDKKNLIKLASCESWLRPDNSHRNDDTRKTLDRGLWMYNDYWRADVSDECAYNAECSTRQAIKDINAGKKDKWYCTPIVWDKPYRNI